ncbi:glycoside hydrolase family 13 protein [Streptomyces sp. NPDC051976]|uniref:glycoside hydrolase family 13 protein n=1 Tax=Streptomyces sp. NPDC051976 TaxID=3154947 RepID=UPI00343DE850
MPQNADRAAAEWWRSAVIYQVYVRSFADGNGDGIGDLTGLRARLDHLSTLGVDGLWLNPCYPSPQADHGYDVADYRDIDPDYGSLADFDALVDEAHARGLKVLMDLVPNHCSSAHPWFLAALAAAPGSPERDRFLFSDGRGPHGELPPNNWKSVFGGPAWTRAAGPDGAPGQWYLHMYDAAQPDFNWRNPEIADMFDEVLRFWFDRGVDGFRIDVAHGLYKHPDLPDWHGQGFNEFAWDQPEVHEIYRRWRQIAQSYGPQRELTLVGEVWVPTAAALVPYLRDDELPQAFFFDLLMQTWDAALFRDSIDRAFAAIGSTGATITWTLANHDVHRAVTRYGITERQPHPFPVTAEVAYMRPRGQVDVALGERRARAAIMLLLALPGSHYLYQGEELGLPEVLDLPSEARQDPAWARSGQLDVGRDGCRVPLPWTTDAAGFGFSPSDAAEKPWLPQPQWFAKYALSEQIEDAGSTFALHRGALRTRRELFSAADGDITWLTHPGNRPDVLAFRRGNAVCVTVFGDEGFTVPATWGEMQLSSQPLCDRVLPGGSTAWTRIPRLRN